MARQNGFLYLVESADITQWVEEEVGAGKTSESKSPEAD